MRQSTPYFRFLLTILITITITAIPSTLSAQEEELPYYLNDRGIGVPSSMFGTYIERGDLITYLYFEYYYDQDYEYKPFELGYGLREDFRGRYRANEGLIFIGYGITEWLALEIEAAVIEGTLRKSPTDPSAVPNKITESGLGDVESQLRWRWQNENLSRPEIFSYFETVFPLQKNKKLIGTQDWEFKLGAGITKGFHFGTFTLRTAFEYDRGESKFEFGEYAIEYLKRISPRWRVYIGVEGEQDEVELITEAQLHIITNVMILKLNSAFGVTSKATDWAPEVGIMYIW